MCTSLNQFRTFLEQTDVTESTIAENIMLVRRWLKWSEKPIADIKYKDLLDYLGYLHECKKSPTRINKIMVAIGHYYKSCEIENLAANVRVRGVVIKALLPSIPMKTLEQIYQVFTPTIKGRNDYVFSDKLIVGMMIYQGLEWSDFLRIELRDLNLGQGKLYVPETKLRKSRYVTLEAHQVLPLHKYISQYRDQSCGSDKLLSPQGEVYNLLHWQYKLLSKELKKQLKEKLGLELKKLNQLRESRIRHWVEQHGMIKAQYLSGLRSAVTVGRYKDPDLKQLKKKIKKYHPF